MTFKLDNDIDIGGTSRTAGIRLVPAVLVKRFGPPREADGYKVSGEYVFTDDEGNVYTLYDWKATDVYAYDMPSARILWGSSKPFEFHIGSRQDAAEDIEALKTWLAEKTVE